jgi:RAQPRD family integrative conjugative element protein
MRNIITLLLLGLHIVASAPMAQAASADEHIWLALLLEQLCQVETLADADEASVSRGQHERYAFDYPASPTTSSACAKASPTTCTVVVY